MHRFKKQVKRVTASVMAIAMLSSGITESSLQWLAQQVIADSENEGYELGLTIVASPTPLEESDAPNLTPSSPGVPTLPETEENEPHLPVVFAGSISVEPQELEIEVNYGEDIEIAFDVHIDLEDSERLREDIVLEFSLSAPVDVTSYEISSSTMTLGSFGFVADEDTGFVYGASNRVITIIVPEATKAYAGSYYLSVSLMIGDAPYPGETSEPVAVTVLPITRAFYGEIVIRAISNTSLSSRRYFPGDDIYLSFEIDIDLGDSRRMTGDIGLTLELLHDELLLETNLDSQGNSPITLSPQSLSFADLDFTTIADTDYLSGSGTARVEISLENVTRSHIGYYELRVTLDFPLIEGEESPVVESVYSNNRVHLYVRPNPGSLLFYQWLEDKLSTGTVVTNYTNNPMQTISSQFALVDLGSTSGLRNMTVADTTEVLFLRGNGVTQQHVNLAVQGRETWVVLYNVNLLGSLDFLGINSAEPGVDVSIKNRTGIVSLGYENRITGRDQSHAVSSTLSMSFFGNADLVIQGGYGVSAVSVGRDLLVDFSIASVLSISGADGQRGANGAPAQPGTAGQHALVLNSLNAILTMGSYTNMRLYGGYGGDGGDGSPGHTPFGRPATGAHGISGNIHGQRGQDGLPGGRGHDGAVGGNGGNPLYMPSGSLRLPDNGDLFVRAGLGGLGGSGGVGGSGQDGAAGGNGHNRSNWFGNGGNGGPGANGGDAGNGGNAGLGGTHGSLAHVNARLMGRDVPSDLLLDTVAFPGSPGRAGERGQPGTGGARGSRGGALGTSNGNPGLSGALGAVGQNGTRIVPTNASHVAFEWSSGGNPSAPRVASVHMVGLEYREPSESIELGLVFAGDGAIGVRDSIRNSLDSDMPRVRVLHQVVGESDRTPLDIVYVTVDEGAVLLLTVVNPHNTTLHTEIDSYRQDALVVEVALSVPDVFSFVSDPVEYRNLPVTWVSAINPRIQHPLLIHGGYVMFFPSELDAHDDNRFLASIDNFAAAYYRDAIYYALQIELPYYNGYIWESIHQGRSVFEVDAFADPLNQFYFDVPLDIFTDEFFAQFRQEYRARLVRFNDDIESEADIPDELVPIYAAARILLTAYDYQERLDSDGQTYRLRTDNQSGAFATDIVISNVAPVMLAMSPSPRVNGYLTQDFELLFSSPAHRRLMNEGFVYNVRIYPLQYVYSEMAGIYLPQRAEDSEVVWYRENLTTNRLSIPLDYTMFTITELTEDGTGHRAGYYIYVYLYHPEHGIHPQYGHVDTAAHLSIAPPNLVLRFDEFERTVRSDATSPVSINFRSAGRYPGTPTSVEVIRNGQVIETFTTTGDSVNINPSLPNGVISEYEVRVTVYGFIGRILEAVTSFTVFNVDAITIDMLRDVLDNTMMLENLSSEEILALNRNGQIGLTTTMGISNPNQWPVRERLAWATTDNNLFRVGIQDGSSFVNLRQAGNTFSPVATIHGLGVVDGNAQVSATHLATGVEVAREVTIQSLQGRLFILNVLPRTTTTVTFTNGLGDLETHTTNSNGEIAIFSDSGVRGNFYLRAEHNSRVYLGRVMSTSLQTGERTTGLTNAYPINSVALRPASNQTFYTYRPNGQPYTGRVAVQAALYRNGVYVVGSAYSGVHTVGTGGSFTINMDSTTFGTLSNDDSLLFKYELRFLDGDYAPYLFTVDGFASVDQSIALGDSIIQLFPWDSIGATWIRHLFDTPRGGLSDVSRNTTFIGINDQNRVGVLTTTLVVAGDVDATSIRIQDQFGVIPVGQGSRVLTHEFLSGDYTFIQVELDVTEALQISPGQTRGYTIYLTANGNVHGVQVPFEIINMIGLTPPDEYMEMVIDLSDAQQDSIFAMLFGDGLHPVLMGLINSIVPTGVEFEDEIGFTISITRDPNNPLMTTIRGVYTQTLWEFEREVEAAAEWEGTWNHMPEEDDLVRPRGPELFWLKPHYHPYAYAIHSSRDVSYIRAARARKPDVNNVGFIRYTGRGAVININSPRYDSAQQYLGTPFAHISQHCRHILEPLILKYYAELAEYYRQRAEREQRETARQAQEEAFDRLFDQTRDSVNRGQRPESTTTATASASARASVEAEVEIKGFFEAQVGFNLHTMSFERQITQFGLKFDIDVEASAGAQARAGIAHVTRIPVPAPVPGLVITLEFNAGAAVSLDAELDLDLDIEIDFLNPDINFDLDVGIAIAVNAYAYLRVRGAVGMDIGIAAANVGAYLEGRMDFNYRLRVLPLPVDHGGRLDYQLRTGIDWMFRIGPRIRLFGRQLWIEQRGYFAGPWERRGNVFYFGNQSLLPASPPLRARDMDATFMTPLASFIDHNLLQGHLPPNISPDDAPVITGGSNFRIAAWSTIELTDDEVEEIEALHMALFAEESLLLDDEISSDWSFDDSFLEGWNSDNENPLNDDENLDLHMELDTHEMIAWMNRSEIVAQLYRNGWGDYFRITTNNRPDINPMVAVDERNQTAVVGWQQMSFYENGQYVGVDATTLWLAVYDNGWQRAVRVPFAINGRIVGQDIAINGTEVAITLSLFDYAQEAATDGIYAIHMDLMQEFTINRLTSDNNINVAPQVVAYGQTFIVTYFTDNHTEGVRDVVLTKLASNNVWETLNVSVANSSSLAGFLPGMGYQLVGGSQVAIVWPNYDANTNTDVITASMLVNNGGQFSVTTPIVLGHMPLNPTILDTAIVNNTITVEYLNASDWSVNALSAQFTNRILHEVSAHEDDVIPNTLLPVGMRIINAGLEPISSIHLVVGSATAIFNDVVVQPGEYLTDWISKPLHDTIYNVNYTVTASFNSGTDVAHGSLRLARTDISIGAITAIRQHQGRRYFALSLGNLSHVPLAGSGHNVHLSFYHDPGHTLPVTNLQGNFTISDNERLALIDQSALSQQFVYTVTHGDLDTLGEISGSGIHLFVRAYITDANGNVVQETSYSQNRATVRFDSLLIPGQEPVQLTTRQFDGQNAILTLTNRSMNTVSEGLGRVVAVLHNHQNEPIETLSLPIDTAIGYEDSIDLDLLFTQTGAGVTVSFAEIVEDVSLTQLALSGIPFVFAGSDRYTVENIHAIRTTNLTAIASHPEAVITILGNVFAGGIATHHVVITSESETIQIEVELFGQRTSYQVTILTETDDIVILPPLPSPGDTDTYQPQSQPVTGPRPTVPATIPTPTPQTAQQNHNTILAQLTQDNDDPVALSTTADLHIVNLYGKTLQLLIDAEQALTITSVDSRNQPVVWVVLSIEALSETLASSENYELSEQGIELEPKSGFADSYYTGMFIITLEHEFAEEELYLSVALRAYLNHEPISRLESGLDLYARLVDFGGNNTYRVVAKIAGDGFIGGFLNKENSLFGVETQYWGEIVITYVADLTRLRMSLHSPVITNLAQNWESDITMDVLPLLIGSRTMIPVRFVSYALGIGVDWAEETSTVTLTDRDTTISLVIGELSYDIDVPTQIVDGRTLVPLRFIAQAFGATVNWSESGGIIEIIR